MEYIYVMDIVYQWCIDCGISESQRDALYYSLTRKFFPNYSDGEIEKTIKSTIEELLKW